MKIERKRLVLLSLLIFGRHHRFCHRKYSKNVDAEDIRRGEDAL